MDLPETGTAAPQLLERMRASKAGDADWRAGRTFSLVYPAGDDVEDVLREANALYAFENALNPRRFPSVSRMESEVGAMTASLLHGGADAVGTMTSGGTESILLAVKAARDRALAERGVTRPQMLVPDSAHPAFAKAGEFLGVETRHVPLLADRRVDVAATGEMANDRTVLIAGSAPSYPYGVIDPIEELASLALDIGCSFHTDACIGGFLLPFLERLGEPVPPFDFRVPGVTTMSADVHKYGYGTKGASVIVHRSRETFEYQVFRYDGWPGGRYGSNAMAGARPSAPIAAAWAVMNYLGRDGYVDRVDSLRSTVALLRRGIEEIPGLRIHADPFCTPLSFGSETLDIMAVGDEMEDRRWHLGRQSDPAALHMVISPHHHNIAAAFLRDLSAAAASHGTSRGAGASYS